MTNIGEGDHLGLSGIETLEKLALVKRTIVDVVLPKGSAVLKADDPLVAEMAPKCPGSVIFFCRDGEHAVVREARARGGRAVFVRDDHIVLAEGVRETVLAALASVPLTYHGRVAFQVENVLAAAAAAWSMGIPLDVIRMALATFAGDTQQAPGRFNVLEANGATVIVDYGHNPSAVAALIEALEVFPHKRRSIVFSAEGDRRDEHILRQMELRRRGLRHRDPLRIPRPPRPGRRGDPGAAPSGARHRHARLRDSRRRRRTGGDRAGLADARAR